MKHAHSSPTNDTPELTNANIGKIKLTRTKECSTFSDKDIFSPESGVFGSASATIIPANVAALQTLKHMPE